VSLHLAQSLDLCWRWVRFRFRLPHEIGTARGEIRCSEKRDLPAIARSGHSVCHLIKSERELAVQFCTVSHLLLGGSGTLSMQESVGRDSTNSGGEWMTKVPNIRPSPDSLSAPTFLQRAVELCSGKIYCVWVILVIVPFQQVPASSSKEFAR